MVSESNGGAVEPEQAKGDLFSSMKNQMSSWLTKKDAKDASEITQEETKPEFTPETEVVEERKVEDGTETEADKESFGTGNLLS